LRLVPLTGEKLTTPGVTRYAALATALETPLNTESAWIVFVGRDARSPFMRPSAGCASSH
jgi:hypothetical protein